jgi:hypothetical protein
MTSRFPEHIRHATCRYAWGLLEILRVLLRSQSPASMSLNIPPSHIAWLQHARMAACGSCPLQVRWKRCQRMLMWVRLFKCAGIT